MEILTYLYIFFSLFIYLFVYLYACIPAYSTRGMRCEYDWILAPARNLSKFDRDNGNQKGYSCFGQISCLFAQAMLLDTCLKIEYKICVAQIFIRTEQFWP